MPSFEGLDYATPLTINGRTRELVSETLNLKRQAVGNGAQRWEMTITLAPTLNDSSNAAGARLSVHRTLHGLSASFDMPMPQLIGLSIPTGAVSTTGAGSIGANIVSMNSEGSTMMPGTFFRFTAAAHTKIYQVTAVSGSSVSFSPSLINAVSSGAGVSVDGNIRVYYAQDGQSGVSYQDGVLTNATISVVEAV